MKNWFVDEKNRIMITKHVLPFHRIHKLANQYPLMSDEEREVLKQSLLKSGQLNPIMLYNGEIIDGRNRYLVMQELAVKGQLTFKPDIREFRCKEKDLPKIVEALNLHRRHLTPSQKAAIGVKNHLEIQKQLAQERQHKGDSVKVSEGGKTAEVIAKMVGVSTTYVEKAMKVRNDQELFSLLEEGKINIVDAEIIASRATPEQREEIIDKIKYNLPGLRYRISSITPRKKQKPKNTEFQIPAIIVLKNVDGDNETSQLIRQKIQELQILLDACQDGNPTEIWYKTDSQCTDDLKGELVKLYKKMQSKRLPEE